MIKKLIITAAVGSMILTATSAAFAADATVTVKGSGAGLIVGRGFGTGVLTYKGYDIPFEWKNFSFGKVGSTHAEAVGEVDGLTFLEKFNGCYSSGNIDATVGTGGFTRQLKNKGGVVVNLKGKEKGLDVSVSTSCAKVVMDPEVLASVLAKLNQPPVAANYSNSIYFDTNSQNIRKTETNKLDTIISELEKTPGTEVIVTGYTDTTGAESHNQKLSEERADAVVEAITDRVKTAKVTALPPKRVVVTGKGEAEGKDNNAEQNHRRVDILIIHPDNVAKG